MHAGLWPKRNNNKKDVHAQRPLVDNSNNASATKFKKLNQSTSYLHIKGWCYEKYLVAIYK